jgi:hypothetical protein
LTHGHVGIGIKIAKNQYGQQSVTSVLPGGPADETGQLFPGDIILAINGIDVKPDSTVDHLSSLIIGPPGGIVDMRLQDKGHKEELHRTVCSQDDGGYGNQTEGSLLITDGRGRASLTPEDPGSVPSGPFSTVPDRKAGVGVFVSGKLSVGKGVMSLVGILHCS